MNLSAELERRRLAVPWHVRIRWWVCEQIAPGHIDDLSQHGLRA